MRVVEIVTECEHGKSRRVLEPGEYVLVEDVHDLPRDAWRILNAAAVFGHPGGSAALWKDLRAALRGDPIPSADAVERPCLDAPRWWRCVYYEEAYPLLPGEKPDCVEYAEPGHEKCRWVRLVDNPQEGGEE